MLSGVPCLTGSSTLTSRDFEFGIPLLVVFDGAW